MTSIANVLQDSVRKFGADNSKKFLVEEIFVHWNSLVDKNISAHVVPVELEHGTLFVNVKNSAFKDQLKFFAEEIIDAVNERFGNGDEIVTDVKIARPYQVAAFDAKKIRPAPVVEPVEKILPAVVVEPVVKPKILSVPKPEPVREDDSDETFNREEIFLSDEEISRCKKSVERIEDADVRRVALETLLSQAKYKKFRLANGWHKCQACESLCAATETFCEVCRLKERDKLIRSLFEIFYDTPWLNSVDVQKIFVEKFPNKRDDCPLDVVNSARTSLVQNLAARLTRDDDLDESSYEILRLVMLERQLPPDKVTPAIIRRTLGELQFNFADPIRFHRYKFSKFRNLQRK